MMKLSGVQSYVNEEQELIASLEQITESLESKKHLGDESKKIIENLGFRLINICSEKEQIEDKTEEVKRINEIEHHLILIHEKITSFEEQSLIWDSASDPEEAFDYIKDIEKARNLMKILENISSEDGTLLRLSIDVIYRGITRLEDEFRTLLVQKHQSFEVVSPDVIPFLRAIANLMFVSNYGHKCSQVYINVRKDALDECLCDLEFENLSVEDVLKMEWEDLDRVIMKWIRTIDHFVQVQLTNEKSLANQIFEDIESVSNTCFYESSNESIVSFFNFVEVICNSPYRPEELLRVLNMYEVLSDLTPKINELFSFDAGSCVTTKCEELLGKLGDYLRATFLEFRSAIAPNSSENVKAGGGVHALTSYVMNYLKALADSRATFDEIMMNFSNEDYLEDASNITPAEIHFRSIITILESNLEEISKLYKGESLRHIFLMNNLHYIAEKMKGSELIAILGENWIRKQIPKFQNHANEYQKTTWNSILAFLRDEGINKPFSNSASRTILKERLCGFYVAFEDVYRNQSGWTIPDIRLRDDLTISISLKVIQAYRSFVGRYGLHINEKYIKYSGDDLEGFLLDLFVGSHRSLHGGFKKLY